MVNILSPQDIIQTSLVGLGLIIALYAILTDKIKELQKTKNSKRSRWIENRKNMLGKMVNDIDNIDLDEEFEDPEGEFDNVLVPPLHVSCRCAMGIVLPEDQGQEEEG